jgi:putative transcriptional regulator
MIRVNLDIMMAKRRIGLSELAERMDITPANLSIHKTNKASHTLHHAERGVRRA